jgi:hypothetical protein
VQAEELGAGPEVVEGVGALDAQGLLDAVGQVGVVEEDVQAQRLGA